MRRFLLVAIPAFLLASPTTASAYRFQPEHHRWETARIPVWVGSASLRSPTARAISKWNALHLRVHFTRVASRRQAFVTIRLDGNACVGGVTQVLGARESGVVIAERARNPIRADDRAGARALYRRPLSTLPLSAYRRFFAF
jgi:hypothetical protein